MSLIRKYTKWLRDHLGAIIKVSILSVIIMFIRTHLNHFLYTFTPLPVAITLSLIAWLSMVVIATAIVVKTEDKNGIELAPPRSGGEGPASGASGRGPTGSKATKAAEGG